MPQLHNFLHAVKDEDDVAVVKGVLKNFEEQIMPKFEKFRKGIDVNEINNVVYWIYILFSLNDNFRV